MKAATRYWREWRIWFNRRGALIRRRVPRTPNHYHTTVTLAYACSNVRHVIKTKHASSDTLWSRVVTGLVNIRSPIQTHRSLCFACCMFEALQRPQNILSVVYSRFDCALRSDSFFLAGCLVVVVVVVATAICGASCANICQNVNHMLLQPSAKSFLPRWRLALVIHRCFRDGKHWRQTMPRFAHCYVLQELDNGAVRTHGCSRKGCEVWLLWCT